MYYNAIVLRFFSDSFPQASYYTELVVNLLVKLTLSKRKANILCKYIYIIYRTYLQNVH